MVVIGRLKGDLGYQKQVGIRKNPRYNQGFFMLCGSDENRLFPISFHYDMFYVSG